MRKLVCVLGVALLAVAAQATGITPGNLVVERIGTGSAPLATSTATAVFLDEYTPAGFLVQSIPMPTAPSGNNKILTNSGTSSAECFVKLSVDRQYLTLMGYNATPGTTGVATSTSAAVNRTVAKVSVATGAVDTSTAFTDVASGSSPRTAITTNGTDLWLNGGAGGVRYSTFGSTTSSQLNTANPVNTRLLNIYNGQLYVSSGSTWWGVGTVGTGLPTAPTVTLTELPGFPTVTGPSPYDFYFANSSTLYVADDRTQVNGGGIQKWTFNSGTSQWQLAYTLSLGTVGARGLIGTTNGLGQTVLYATSTTTALVGITDTGSGAVYSTIATAPLNTAFRSVTFFPEPCSLLLLGLGALIRRR